MKNANTSHSQHPDILLADLENPVHAQAVLGLVEAFALEPMSGGKKLSRSIRDAMIPGLRAQPTGRIFLAQLSDRYVGTAICFLGFSTFYAKPVINIHDLIVLEGYRGKGIGRRLLAAVSDHAHLSGCCKVTLEAREDNAGALRLYQSAGFQSGDGKTARLLFLHKAL